MTQDSEQSPTKSLDEIVAAWLGPKPKGDAKGIGKAKAKGKARKAPAHSPSKPDLADDLLAETAKRQGDALRAFREEIARARRDETAVILIHQRTTCAKCGTLWHSPNPTLFLELPITEGRWLLAVEPARAENAALSVPRRVEHIEHTAPYCTRCFTEQCFGLVEDLA